MIAALNKAFVKVKRSLRNIGYKKLAVITIALVLILFLPGFIMNLNIKKQKLPQYEKEGKAAVISQIDSKSGNVLVTSNGGKELSVDTKTLNLKVKDTNTGQQWNSIYEDENSSDADKSPITIKYLGKDGTAYEWDAYRYCIQNNRYTLNKIDNGIQMVFDFYETESYRLNEYIPSKISIKNYEEKFIKKLEEKTAKGEISLVQAERYKSDLDITYQKDTDNNCYFVKFSGLPPVSLVKELISFTKAVEYTTDMLIADSSEFGINVTIVEPARFIVTMDVTLDNGDLVVKIPTYEIENGNDYYDMQKISVLPSLGLASSEKVEDGYIFVPDGSGALFKLNTFNGKYPEYERPVYNNTYYDTLYNMPEFPENLHMPVFGMYYKDSAGKSKGHMGIIEKGAELGYIKVQLGSKDTSKGGTFYNKVYSSFDSMQFSRVKVFGPYSSNDARFLGSTGKIDVDYTVRYRFLTGDVSYYTMAKEYQNYLVGKNNMKVSYDNTPKIFLDVIGSLTLDKRFLGIPYDKTVSMTEYDELLDIMKDLKDINKVVNYKGFFNGGFINTISNKADLTSANGSKKELQNLMKYFDSGSSEMFFNADLMKVSDLDDGFKPKANALYGYDGKPIKFMNYQYATGKFNGFSASWYLLNPLYLSDTVEKFIKDSENFKNIFVNDFGSTYYGNYNPRAIVNPVTSESIVEENLKKLSESKTIALDNPNIDKIAYAKYAANISRESSNYGTMYCSIPFRQLVMNGLIDYTTLNVNMGAERSSYYLLQAFELGSIPKFTISSKSTDLLKNSSYRDYYSIQYTMLKDRIKTLYGEYSEGMAKIDSKEITNHRMLQENVFETTYKSGAAVIVNYNKYPVSVEGHNLDALGYMIQTKN